MRYRLITSLLLLWLAGTVPGPARATQSAAAPPVPAQPEAQGRSYLVYASGLEINTQQDTTEMLFTGGVRIEGRGLLLYTDRLELVLRSDILPQSPQIELPAEGMPSLPDVLENRSSGDDLAKIARELELPRAKFQSDSVRSLKASGNVRFEGQGVVISTDSVESRDGGLNWFGNGRTNMSMAGNGRGSTQLSADGIHLDSAAGIVTASGNITGSYSQPGREESLRLETDNCIFNMNSGLVTVPGEVRLNYGTIDMLFSPLAGEAALQQSVAHELQPLVPQASPGQAMPPAAAGVSIDLPGRVVRARGSVHVADPERGIELDALNLDYLMDEGRMTAWQVELKDIGHGMTMSAPLVEIYTDEKRLEASGMPVLRYQSSSYTGERITVSENADGLLVIEIEGQQLATLDLDELEHFGDEEEDGPGTGDQGSAVDKK